MFIPVATNVSADLAKFGITSKVISYQERFIIRALIFNKIKM